MYVEFIPDDYKFGSVKQRLKIVEGILDTNQYTIEQQGFIEITLASKQLVDDVQFIVESLGGTGKLSKNGDKRQ